MNIKLTVAITLLTLATLPIKPDVPQGPIKFSAAQPSTITATVSFTVQQPSEHGSVTSLPPKTPQGAH